MKPFLLTICCCYIPFITFAQTANTISAKNISKEMHRVAKARISTKSTIGGNYQSGNTEKASLSGTANISAIDSIKEFSFDARYVYGENKNRTNQKEYLVGVQFDYLPLSLFSPFARAEVYGNEFKKINHRYSLLFGAKYRYFVYNKICDYSISVAFLYDYENYTKETQLPNKEKIRISIRPKFKQRIMDNIFITDEIYFKPNIINHKDFIIHNIMHVNFNVNQHVYLRCSYEYEYDSKPATLSVKKRNTIFSFSLGISF